MPKMLPSFRAYGPWDARQERYNRTVCSESDLRNAIKSLMNPAAGAAVVGDPRRLNAGGSITIAGPLTITRPIVIPAECPGITIRASGKFPIHAVGVLPYLFDVRAPLVTIRDLFVSSRSGNEFEVFVTCSGDHCSVISCDVLGKRIFVGEAGTSENAQVLHCRHTPFTSTHDAPIEFAAAKCSAIDNILHDGGGDSVLLASGAGFCRIADNDFGGGDGTSTATSGQNHWDQNANVGNLAIAFLDQVDGTLIRAPQVLTSGTSYTPAQGCKAILVELVGGGAGGGGAGSAAVSASAGGGGGAGGYVRHFYRNPGACTYAIGAAGAGGASGASGSAGGNTTFTDGTTALTASGGTGGSAVAAGTAAATAPGGAGGAASGGGLNVPGGSGGIGVVLSGTVGFTGAGGSSHYGAGGQARQGAAAGIAATGFGGGGGGGLVENGSTGVAGGDGTAGVVIVTEFY